MTKQTRTEAIERSKTEIVEDMHAGLVPATVASFAELHEYRDANEYGGLTEELLNAPAEWDDAEEILAYDIEFGNAVQDAVDAWLRLGSLADIERSA